VDDPDKVEIIKVGRRKIPPGDYRHVGLETRQLFDFDISRVITEYQAQILENDKGECFTASFPAGVTKAVQYYKLNYIYSLCNAHHYKGINKGMGTGWPTVGEKDEKFTRKD